VEQAKGGKEYGYSVLSSAVWPSEPLSSEEVEAAAAYVKKHPDVSSYHLLMALYEQAPAAYGDISNATKAEVLCDALASVVCVSDFGMLGEGPGTGTEPYNGPAGEALVGLGADASPCLREMLHDRRPAYVEGSRASTVSIRYGYRRADYAYRYILLILGRKYEFLPDLARRDERIAVLQKELRGD
jgi:hypothetical protein